MNDATIFSIRENTTLNIEVGGGIRDMESVEFYLSRGVNRVILGSRGAERARVCARGGESWGKKNCGWYRRATAKVAAEGWTAQKQTDYMEMARRMEGHRRAVSDRHRYCEGRYNGGAEPRHARQNQPRGFVAV